MEVLKRLVLRESLKQPLVVIFEDLHWIDSETQGLLDMLADGIANASVLLLMNYRPEYHHEWANKSYYTQLRLDALGRENAAAMLEALLGKATELEATGLEPFKRLIIEKTGGNPFFIEEMVQALFDEGVILRNGAVKIAHPLSQLRLPPTVQGIPASRIDRLAPAQKDLLQTLAVIGRESPLAIISKIVPRPDSELDQMLAILQAGEFIYEQPVVSGIEYMFKHALTQEVAYNSLLIERRRQLHERTAQAIESTFAGHLEDYLTGLAHHYSQADNVSKAAEYLGQVGQQAIQRSAHTDAISSLDSAISLLHKLPDNRERALREVRLELTRARALAIKTGFASEVEQAFIRARELSERLGFAQELSSALLGLCGQYVAQGRFQTVYELAKQIQRRAELTQDLGPLISALAIVGLAEYELGDSLLSRDHLERAIFLYDRERDKPVGLRTAYDPGVAGRYYAGATLWHLGYPDQALRKTNEAVAPAQELSNPLNLASAELAASALLLLRGEACAAQDIAERMIVLCSEQGLSYWLAKATRLRDWAVAEQGSPEARMVQIENGPVPLRAIWDKLVGRLDRIKLIEVWIKIARVDQRPCVLKEMLVIADENEHGYLSPEINWLKGQLLLIQEDSKFAEAENCFQRAIEVAHKQSAKSIELRATTSLARLLASRGRRDEARTILTDIYNWFTEGFDTADLKHAKALLEQL
jgi:predicted ATPase